MKKSISITGFPCMMLVSLFLFSAKAGKAQWTQTGFNATMAGGNSSMSILVDAVGIYASTSDFHFYRSDDNGATFSDVAQSGIVQGVGIRGIFKMSDTLFIIDNTKISRSVDNGANWSTVLPMYCSGFWISPEQGTIIVQGSVTTTTVVVSNDRGNTWSSPAFPSGTSSTMYLQGFGDLNDSITIFHGQNNSAYRLLISGDKGATWQLRNFVNTFVSFASYTSLDTTVVIAGSRWNPYPNMQNGPFVSYNEGQSFSFIPTSCSASTANDFIMKTINNVIYMYGTDNSSGSNITRLYKSTDQGVSWTDITGNLPSRTIKGLYEYNGVIYVGLRNDANVSGEIWSTGQGIGLPSAQKESNKLIVFPNPATTTITLPLSVDEKISSVKLVDVKGSFSEAILNGNNLDITQLDEGIYFMELITDKQLYHARFIKQ